MKQFQQTLVLVSPWRSFFRMAPLLIALVASATTRGHAAPMLVSVTPADGATGVNMNSNTIVFVFNEDMDTVAIPLPSFPPFFVGNFEVLPSTLTFSGMWEEDERTLTLESATPLPPDTIISWKLNPPGGGIVPPLRNASGEALATISGSFRTAASVNTNTGPAPKLVSIMPANGATDVSPTTAVSFVFDRDMDTNVMLVPSAPPFVVGNYHFAPSTVLFTGSWGSDRRTLTFESASIILPNTLVTWTLNPAGTTVPLKSTGGQPLAATNGSFRIIANTGGNTNEMCQGPPPLAGSYFLTKALEHSQTSASVVVPRRQAPANFNAFVQGPVAGPPVTNASVTLPNNSVKIITNQFGFFTLHESYPTEAALESADPPGTYTMRFTQTGQTERVIPMNMPMIPTSVPMIANYTEAQAIDSTQSFTLRWNSFTPQGAGAFINVVITDQFGNLIFQAPNPCVPRTLAPTATSVAIPANYFRPGLTYNGLLSFGLNFYNSTNAVPQMFGYGAVQRTTSFILQTTSGPGPGTAPATFTSYRVLSNGHPQFNLSGTAGKSYTIQRAGRLVNPNWTTAGTVTMNASGQAVFEDSTSGLVFPAFYRAVGN